MDGKQCYSFAVLMKFIDLNVFVRCINNIFARSVKQHN